MRKIQDSVRDLVFGEEEALYALAHDFMNMSAYAKRIKKRVEKQTMKVVGVPSIVVALSRIQAEMDIRHPLLQNVVVKNITTKSPLSELVFEKNLSLLSKLSLIYTKVRMGSDDFLSMSLSTNEVTIICSERIQEKILALLKEKPRLIARSLAAVGLSFDEKYYKMPNVTYSLLRKIARKKIVLAETITTHTEIIFVFDQRRLADVVGLFQETDC